MFPHCLDSQHCGNVISVWICYHQMILSVERICMSTYSSVKSHREIENKLQTLMTKKQNMPKIYSDRINPYLRSIIIQRKSRIQIEDQSRQHSSPSATKRFALKYIPRISTQVTVHTYIYITHIHLRYTHTFTFTHKLISSKIGDPWR